MLDVTLFRNARFSAASGSVTVAFFAIAGFSFLITQYFQLFKHYSPLSTGVHLLPVALSPSDAASVIGTKLAVRVRHQRSSRDRPALHDRLLLVGLDVHRRRHYWQIALQMLLAGTGVGLTSAPATDRSWTSSPRAKAGVGSAINDTTRLIGATLGVAIIGSVYASLYLSRLKQRSRLAALRPRPRPHRSVGGAIQVANQAEQRRPSGLAAQIHQAASPPSSTDSATPAS